MNQNQFNGATLRHYRLRAGYSQDQAGAIIGTASWEISEWERGTRAPDQQVGDRLVEVLRGLPKATDEQIEKLRCRAHTARGDHFAKHRDRALEMMNELNLTKKQMMRITKKQGGQVERWLLRTAGMKTSTFELMEDYYNKRKRAAIPKLTLHRHALGADVDVSDAPRTETAAPNTLLDRVANIAEELKHMAIYVNAGGDGFEREAMAKDLATLEFALKCCTHWQVVKAQL